MKMIHSPRFFSRKALAGLSLFLALLLAALPALAADQEVTCETAHFTLLLPSSFSEAKPTRDDDPDLCFHYVSKSIEIQGYYSYVGKIRLKDLPQVYDGELSEYTPIKLNGREMLYAEGKDETGDYILYTWLDEVNNVMLCFLYRSGDKKAPKTIEKIMDSIVFDE